MGLAEAVGGDTLLHFRVLKNVKQSVMEKKAKSLKANTKKAL